MDFWFSIGSTYTYLTVARIKNIIKNISINIKLKPFNVRTIMLEMDNRPFPPSKKIKVDHMWRDIQRRAEIYEIVIPSMPVPYPLKNMEIANQIALLGVNEGWCLDYLELTYYNWFVNKLPAGEEENLILTFKELNLNYEKIKKNAVTNEIENNLIKQTKIAKSKGIFGAPTFIVEKELFWGDDRFEDAIKWYNK
ncbi:MAG: 2-hydroxychromene-2-carboxylate isomerase [Pelagibacterales bacterium]|nr:2-hydroxychromene-2-carboxylate isomerase [Pelagibacterales bacterium]